MEKKLIFDLINSLFSGTLIFIFFYVYKIPMKYYIIIIMHLVLVFLTNNLLFPISYMPDQFRYINSASHIRESLDFIHFYDYDSSITVSTASGIFSLFPIPFLKSVFSIAIINFILYATMFIFLYRKKILRGYGIYFYLFYPSFALYSAIGTRDTLILFFMILSVYQVHKGNTILSIVISLPLLLIKFQNFFIFFLSLLIYKGIDKGNIFSLKNIYKIILSLIATVIFLQFFSIEEINSIRLAMYIEDGGEIDNYVALSGYLDFIITSFSGAFYMVLKPFIWEAHSVLQIIQSIENIFIFIILYKLTTNLKRVKNPFKNFLMVYFLIAMAIYGIVVFNFGTASRYKYTFIIVFIIFSIKLIRDNKFKQGNL